MMKSYLKYLLLLLTINTAFAQLTVRNSAYVFVTDEIVFVEDYLKLNEANSMFYLRDEGQFIQGAGTTGNTGIGQLSVFQTGSVDNYAYNYWCSPVGNTTADTVGNRGFVGGDVMYDWTGGITDKIGSTIADYASGLDGISSPLKIASAWMYSFNSGTEYSDWSHVGNLNDLSPGYGFSMKGSISSAGQLYDFRGKPNSGDISTAVNAGKITLVGNPFPSALDAKEYLYDATNQSLITGTLFFWEHDTSVKSHNVADYVGGYASLTVDASGVPSFIEARFDTYTSDGTLNNTGATSTNPKKINRYIPVGQGFMVEGIADGNIYARNSHRAYIKQSDIESSVLFKTANGKGNKGDSQRDDDDILFEVPDDYKRFRLNIDFDDTYTDQLIQNFHESATEGFDYGLEIVQAYGAVAEVYFKNPEDSFRLLAQAHQFNRDLRIPLIFELTEQKSIRIRVIDIQNLEERQEIFIRDKENDIYYNLRENNLEINLDEGLHDSEYEITFRNFNIPDDPIVIDDNKDVFITQNNNNSSLTVMNPSNFDIKDVKIYDIAGKRVMKDKNIGNASQHEFSTINLSNGTYVISIKFNDGSKPFIKKLIVNNKK